MIEIENALERLAKSNFRSGFHLSQKDREYIAEKGTDTIKQHARDFVKNRISADYPKNDGKQTPMRGHPVFKAMHGCACCCRGCLNKWYKIPQGRELTQAEQDNIVDLLMAWIGRQM